MEMINYLKRLIRSKLGVTFVETMVAVSILAISMTYVALDSRFTANAIRNLNEQDKMLYSAQEAVERFKLEQVGGQQAVNGYTIDIDVISDSSQDPNINAYLKKVVFTTHPKAKNWGIDDLVLVSYVFYNTTGAPNAPPNLVATPNTGGIVLNWQQSPNTIGYNVYRSEIPGGPYTLIKEGVSGLSYTDVKGEANGVFENVTYYYVVAGWNDIYGEGGKSNEASATIIINSGFSAPLIADSYIRGGSYAANNFGTESNLYFSNPGIIGWLLPENIYKTYLRFDLSGVNGNILNAQLKLYGYNSSTGSNINADIYKLSNDTWTENTINYNNASSEESLINTIALGGKNSPGYGFLNVTDYCKDELAGDKTISFVVYTNSSNLGIIQSKEGTYPPILEIEWTPHQPPPPPQNLTATPGNKQVVLNWDVVIGAESYIVKRSSNSGGPYTIINPNVTSNTFTDINLTNGTTYYYVVSSRNSMGESINSNEAKATPNVIVTVVYNPQADAFIRDGGYSAINYGLSQKLEVNSSTVSGEKRISYYKFDLSNLRGEVINAKLRLYGSNIEDSNSALLNCREVNDNSWQENTITANNAPILGNQIGTFNVTGVQIYNEIDITDYIKTKLLTDNIVNIAVSGSVQKLISFNSREAASNKPELVIEKTLLVPNPPSNLSAVPDDGKVTLNWSASNEADSYNVKRSTTDGGPYTIIRSNVTSTNYVDTDVVNKTRYYYVISAVNIAGESANSEQASAMPNIATTMSFNPVADARIESYYPSTNYGSSNTLEVVNNEINDKKSYLRFDMKGYTNNTIVSAKLRLYGRSNVEEFKVNVHGVSNNSWYEIGANGIRWNNAPPLEDLIGSTNIGTVSGYYEIDVTKYVAQVSEVSTLVSMGINTDVFSPNNATFNSKEAASGKPVLFINMVQDVPKQPKNLIAVGGNKYVDLSWQPAEGATSYTIKRGTASGGPYTTTYPNITATTYRNTGLSNGNNYYYVVTAVNENGESIESNETCGIPNRTAMTRTLLPIADTYIRDGSFVTNNFGSETSIGVSKSTTLNDGNNRNGFIKYDLSTVTSNPTSATLMLTGRNITNNWGITVDIYRLSNDMWDEYALNWNTAPGPDASLIGSIYVDKKYQTKSLNVTSFVRTEWANDKKVSFYIRAYTNNRVALFSSKEGTDPPLLQINY